MSATQPLLYSTTQLHPTPPLTLVEPIGPPADDRYDTLRRACPACGLLGVRIVYGHPSAELVDAAARGKVLLGGCTHRIATHRCPYGFEWHSPDAD